MIVITNALDTEQPPTPSSQPALNIADALSRVTDLERHARAWISERPVIAVLGAVGIGYVIARMLSRGARWAR